MTTYPIPRDAVTPCAEDPDLFFPDKSASPKHVARATKLCDSCPWLEGCLAWAIVHGEQGIWGATDDKFRAEVRARSGIKAQRVQYKTGTAHGPTAANLVPHGTPVGVETHRRRYEPLCDDCFGFDVERKNGRGVAS